MSATEKIIKFIKKARAEKNWSQADLAFQLGTHRTTIVAYETGKTVPSGTVIFRIAELLGKEIEMINKTE